jgi:hypothetical protein
MNWRPRLRSRNPNAGSIWWLISVPYAFAFGLFVAAFPGYTWTILHNFVPLVIVYWVTYYSAFIWLVIFVWSNLFSGARGFKSFRRLAIAVIAVIVPLVFGHRWPGF